MSYRATRDSSSQSPEERAAEAIKILFEMGLADNVERMSHNEQSFVYGLLGAHDTGALGVSVKQLWWLRDLKDKYL